MTRTIQGNKTNSLAVSNGMVYATAVQFKPPLNHIFHYDPSDSSIPLHFCDPKSQNFSSDIEDTAKKPLCHNIPTTKRYTWRFVVVWWSIVNLMKHFWYIWSTKRWILFNAYKLVAESVSVERGISVTIFATWDVLQNKVMRILKRNSRNWLFLLIEINNHI